MTEQLFLIAHIAGRAVGIDTAQVQSVVDIGTIVDVPRTARHVRGLAALRSRVVTVIDTVAALGLEGGHREGGRAIITKVDGHYYALLVDALDDVAPFAAQPLTGGMPLGAGWAQVACGLIERDGEPMLLVDLAALVHGPATRTANAA